MKEINIKYDYYSHSLINNLADLLELAFNKYGKNIAFSFLKGKNRIEKTYEDVYYEVASLSEYFRQTHKNKHIALIGENSYNYIIAFLAIVLSNNTCVIIDKDLSEADIIKLLKKSDTKIICYSKNYNTFIKDMHYLTIPLEDLSTLAFNDTKKIRKDDIDDNKGAVIFFTSGTTGDYKAVLLSQLNIARDIYGASSLFKPNGSVVSLLPFHHAFGLITAILKPFYYGKEVYLNNSLKYVLRDLQENKPDTIFVVPAFVETFYRQIWRTARAKNKEKMLKKSLKISNFLLKLNIDLRKKFFHEILEEFGGNLHYIICGGANLDKKYVKWFRSIGINILNGYGITECSPVVAVNRNHYYKDGSVGQICRDVIVKIIDDEICVKGKIVMQGYYKDSKSTKEVLQDGYFHTGDLGYIDEDGFLFITGRKKNIIVLSNGENISPKLIENELSKDKGISEVVVTEEANKLIAYIYPEDEYLGEENYFDNLIYNYNKNKPKSQQLAMVKLRTSEFIKNNNGKILRNKIREER